ncbi:peroxidasin-like [Mytilus trossulus]|uniref:peroxidasin-like n=1 Tax=Mytilus trossulus TaxID=6551 RepID=UPI003006737E
MKIVTVCIVFLVSVNARQESKGLDLERLQGAIKNSQIFTGGLENTKKIEGEKTAFKLPSEETIKILTEEAITKFNKTEQENKRFFENKIDKPNLETPMFGPHMLTDKRSLEINKPGQIIAETTEAIVQTVRGKQERKSLSSQDRKEIFDIIQGLKGLRKIPQCPYLAAIDCSSAVNFRTNDGSCNNLANPYWGKSSTPFERYLTPEYEVQGTNLPRITGVSGSALPGAREISTTVHTASVAPDHLTPPLSYFMMQFGQFLDHDITKTAISKGYADSNIQCCENPFRSDCFPINVPLADPFYMGNIDCLNFVRSTATPNLDCSFDYRQQLNELTHYIDGSNVYGSNDDELAQLRDGLTGLMKTSTGNKLPLDTSNNSGCVSSQPCFLAGDKRANVVPGLSSLHTIWVREHNIIAKYLKINNQQWSDEEVFKNARKFVSAEIQHIVYKEFLPKILHPFFMFIFGLNPLSAGYFTGYNQNVKGIIRSEFSTAAYRFGHSLLRDHSFFDSTPHTLHNQFNNPDLVHQPNGIEGCTRGLYSHTSQGIDELLTPEITNKLFQTAPFNGGDLAAFNIQRGRDHGIPPYSKIVEACFGSGYVPTNFNPGVVGGLLFHSATAASKLSSAYSDPADMDLFTAGTAESNLPGMRLGPTFSCIIAAQFKALKDGDRFFYESNVANPFTVSELNSIRQTTMARIICENTEITSLQKDVFYREHPITNKIVNCDTLPSLKLPCTPVDGGWTRWVRISKCFAKRYCTKPLPNDCGKPCVGTSTKFLCILNPATREPVKANSKSKMF